LPTGLQAIVTAEAGEDANREIAQQRQRDAKMRIIDGFSFQVSGGSFLNPRMSGMYRELYDNRQWLWTFVEVEAVEPTNNASESFGTPRFGRSCRSVHKAPRAVGSWRRY
jgi:hypothetical protein